MANPRTFLTMTGEEVVQTVKVALVVAVVVATAALISYEFYLHGGILIETAKKFFSREYLFSR